MKHEKLLVGIMLISILLAGCNTGMTDPPVVVKSSKTTTIDGEILLRAKYYTEQQAESLPNWDGGWEFEPSENQLKLTNLMPDGKIKNNMSYEVTISGTLEKNPMDAFQFVFTVPQGAYTDPWIDLSLPSDAMEIQTGYFFITRTLTTKKDAVVTSGKDTADDPLIYTYAEDYINSGMLAFTNDDDTVLPTDHNMIMAILTNVVITITEK